MIEYFLFGFKTLLTFSNIGIIIFGTTLGIIFGSIPGLTASMAVALCLPISFGMDPMAGFALLVSLYIGGVSGGLIAAVMLNIPGTPSSIATTFDGHPLAMKGEAGKALGTGIFFSFIGTLFGVGVLIFVAPPLAEVAVQFGSYEYFALAVLTLTLISGLSGKSLAKGIAAGGFGMLLAMVGLAPIDGVPRFTYGNYNLDAGFALLPALVGLYAISEIMKSSESRGITSGSKPQSTAIRGFGFSLKEAKSQIVNTIRSSLIGTGVGILPGIGGGTANIIAYTAAKKSSKHPEKFGTGIIDGIVASEASNNASIGGAMVILLTLGIPGDGVTAMLLGGFTIHGMAPGPLLFSNSPEFVYTIFSALILASIAMLILEFFGIRIFIRLLSIPKYYILPMVLVLCLVGSFTINSRMFDVWTLLLFGFSGYFLEKLGFPLPPIILGFILGPMAETNLRRGLQMSKGEYLPFITSPISGVLLGIAFLFVLFTAVKEIKRKRLSHNEL